MNYGGVFVDFASAAGKALRSNFASLARIVERGLLMANKVSTTPGLPKSLTSAAGSNIIKWASALTQALHLQFSDLAALANAGVYGGAQIHSGDGDPNNVVIGDIGDMYLRRDGSTNTTLYVKESGAATDTGWVAK